MENNKWKTIEDDFKDDEDEGFGCCEKCGKELEQLPNQYGCGYVCDDCAFEIIHGIDY
ncbi:putative amidophosphoribosyltransferase [Breznakia sp. PF5-3]|uniref:hypothetical protein n=1 Tax=unclassified Breznakia TaxID=2623764 RepID=UPI002405BAC0|nr:MULTISPECIES: hypothetical protein [unclassified Breznakia]MDF9825201.1 putative amidophosphoribosyltransferase [Breznakia sp. PM6-1]MDF9836059.1 putative amidophosphoribosyltransferase [Breznakia sp. PF5-3]MDF9838875.1 putative amidophosphoribosyltransferase [Breznakia sp. PFB2-8]MDF9860901.1 putative amidophosphoribosyltransferase [Breznakia sp. PH5-24]